jgi:hypothetical protein
MPGMGFGAETAKEKENGRKKEREREREPCSVAAARGVPIISTNILAQQCFCLKLLVFLIHP